MRVFSVAVTFTNNNLNRVIATNGEIAGDKRRLALRFLHAIGIRAARRMQGGDGEAPF